MQRLTFPLRFFSRSFGRTKTSTARPHNCALKKTNNGVISAIARSSQHHLTTPPNVHSIYYSARSITMATPKATALLYLRDAKLLNHTTTISSIRPFSTVEEANRDLFKTATDADYILIAEETIFHPQGGGQPSDEGTLEKAHAGPSSTITESFQITAVRMDAVDEGKVLHLIRATDQQSPADLQPGDRVELTVDAEKRNLYSRLHTAGHVLGSAVRALVEDSVENFDETKASHFPDSAACEFSGSIEGKWKESIQARVNEYLERAMPVEILYWSEEDFHSNGLARLVPDRRLLPIGEDKFRVVRIVGADTYPCGGTHVDTTDLCGATTVKKISRSKGNSRVSYTVA